MGRASLSERRGEGPSLDRVYVQMVDFLPYNYDAEGSDVVIVWLNR